MKNKMYIIIIIIYSFINVYFLSPCITITESFIKIRLGLKREDVT